MRKFNHDGLRNLVFGAQDSLVSTLGVLIGVSSTNNFSRDQIIITGIITIAIEATSMGAGAFLSETVTTATKNKNSVSDGIIMFFSYAIFGLIPLTPFILLNGNPAKYVSIAASLLSLYIIGYFPRKQPRSGIKMAIIAGGAALIGFTIAYFFRV